MTLIPSTSGETGDTSNQCTIFHAPSNSFRSFFFTLPFLFHFDDLSLKLLWMLNNVQINSTTSTLKGEKNPIYWLHQRHVYAYYQHQALA